MKLEILHDKIIDISCGTKGVRPSLAEIEVSEGAKEFIGGYYEKPGKEAFRNIRTFGNNGIFVYTDFLKFEDGKHLFDAWFEKFGKIDNC